MALFGFSSKKEVEEKERIAKEEALRTLKAKEDRAREEGKQNVLKDQQTSLSNLAKGSQVEFAIPYFDVFDPRFENFAVPVAVHGTLVYAVEDIAKFNTLNKTENVSDAVFQRKLKSQIETYVKGIVVNAPAEYQIQVLQLERKMLEISELVEKLISPKVEKIFGINVRAFDVTEITIDKTSYGYTELKSVTSDFERENLTAQHNANLSNFNLKNSLDQDLLKTQSALNIDSLKRQQEMTLSGQEEMQKMQLEMQRLQSVDTLKMQMDNQRETMRIQREEMQRAARLQSESNFLNAHQANLNANVANTKSVFGQQTAQTQGLGLGALQTSGNTMPPIPGSIPQVQYSIALNGQQYGPYGWTQLQQLVQQGQLTQQTYVWTQGMSNWDFAGNIEELQTLFLPSAPQMPPVPGM